MADMQEEFNCFRLSATARIARLERQTGRQTDSGFGFGFGDSIKFIVMAAVLIVAVQLGVQIWLQFRKEKENGNVSLP